MPLMPHIHPSCIIPHAQDKSIDAPAVPRSSTGMPEIALPFAVIITAAAGTVVVLVVIFELVLTLIVVVPSRRS